MRRACELLGTASNHIVGRRGISASNARHLTLPQPESALQAAAAKTSAPPAPAAPAIWLVWLQSGEENGIVLLGEDISRAGLLTKEVSLTFSRDGRN